MQIGIIGGGATGMVAGILAGRRGLQVTILEKNSKLGKKLLVTGNGKCNYTNTYLTPECFHLQENKRAYQIIKDFDTQRILDFFKELGVEVFLREGYAYPQSEQASSIVNALEYELRRLKVRILTDTKVEKIQNNIIKENQKKYKKYTGFKVYTQNQKVYYFDKLIFASGSKAGVDMDGSGIEILKDLGHKIIPMLPALCPMYCEEKSFFKRVAGVRVKAKLTAYIGEKKGNKVFYSIKLAQAIGELQLTDYGISGIPSFQISREVARALYRLQEREKREVYISINFLPYIENILKKLEERKKNTYLKDMESFGNGLLNQKLWLALLEQANISKKQEVHTIDFLKLEKLLGDFCCKVIKVAEYNKAQICTGGIDLGEIDLENMESKKIPGLYLAGEIVDVDGICGGYNLTWAWASGYRVGKNI